MPNRDKTGPEGKGPKTGRGAGPCGNGNSQNKVQRPGASRGQGLGRRQAGKN